MAMSESSVNPANPMVYPIFMHFPHTIGTLGYHFETNGQHFWSRPAAAYDFLSATVSLDGPKGDQVASGNIRGT